MAIVFPPAPLVDEPLLGLRLAEIATSPLSGARGEVAGVPLEALSYATPHRNWYSTLDALAAGQLLAAAEARSWRYILCDQERGVGEIETESNDQQPFKPFVAVHQGTAAQRSIDALRFAETLPEVQNRDFEARFLKVPALNFTALWLHASDRDLLIPVSGQSDVLQPQRAYSEAEVVDALRARAEQARRAPRARPGG
jgi:hypothetical protein